MSEKQRKCSECNDDHYVGPHLTVCRLCRGIDATDNMEWRVPKGGGKFDTGVPMCRECGLRGVIRSGFAYCPECNAEFARERERVAAEREPIVWERR